MMEYTYEFNNKISITSALIIQPLG